MNTIRVVFPGGFREMLDHYNRDPYAGLPVKQQADLWRQTAEQMRRELERLNEEPCGYAVAMKVAGGKVTVKGPSGVLSLKAPPFAIKAGDCLVCRNNGQILDVEKEPEGQGAICTMGRKLSETRYEVETPGNGNVRVAVFCSLEEVPEEGNRVLLDVTGNTIVLDLGKPPSAMAFEEDTGVAWDDIGGQEAAKLALREALEEPFLHGEAYAKFGMRGVRGVLLWGPPGNGKTMLGKAAATSLATVHGKSARAGGFIYVKGPELLSMWQGNSEASVRRLFEAARAHKAANGYPAVVFIDEADALLGKRGVGPHEGHERTIVPQFLAEMDGLDDACCVVVLATNRPDVLDPAVVREGRVDRKVEVGPPTKDDAAAIVNRCLRGRPLGVLRPEVLGAAAASALWSEARPLFMIRSKDGKKDRRVGLSAFVSGAMCAGVAEAAAQRALRRHILDPQDAGISVEDVEAAVEEARAGLKNLDPTAALLPLVAEMGPEFAGVQKL